MLNFQEFKQVFEEEMLKELQNLIKSCDYERKLAVLQRFFAIFGKIFEF